MGWRAPHFPTSILLLALTLPDAAWAEIKIAVAGPMTGPNAPFGEQMKAGAEQAVADINAAGGVNGETLSLSIGDDSCDPKQAMAVANQLASEGVVFVAGHFCSASSIPASMIYAENGIIQISPASTNPAFTDERPGPGVFRVSGRDDQQAQLAGQVLAGGFPNEHTAIIHDNTDYGQSLAEGVRATMEASGTIATLVESYEAGARDYSGLIASLKQEGVAALYFAGQMEDTGLMKRQMAEQGLGAILISSDAIATNDYWAIAGAAGQGTLMTSLSDPRKAPAAADVVSKFRANGIEPGDLALRTYAAVRVWAAAAANAGSAENDRVVQALNDGKFSTVLDEIEFDDKGDILPAPYIVYEWSDGNYIEKPRCPPKCR